MPIIDASEDEVEVPCLRFHYIKSNYFRVIHADGVYGGVSPQGLIQIAFFSERVPIPQQTVHTFDNGKISGEVEEFRVSRDGVVREIETNVLMSVAEAKKLRDWLTQWIDVHSQALENMKKSREARSNEQQ